MHLSGVLEEAQGSSGEVVFRRLERLADGWASGDGAAENFAAMEDDAAAQQASREAEARPSTLKTHNIRVTLLSWPKVELDEFLAFGQYCVF